MKLRKASKLARTGQRALEQVNSERACDPVVSSQLPEIGAEREISWV